jgi:multisubunit Na+/H+ antiporter MnhE subunit
MQRLLAWLAWFGGLFVLWLVFVGTASDRMENIGGLFASALAATAAEVVRSQGLLHFRVERRWWVRLWRQPWRIVADFGIVVLAFFAQLIHPRAHRGSFRTVEFPTGGQRAADRGRRAFVAAVGSLAPNTLVVEVDEEGGELLLHHLVPERAPERPL